MTYREVYEKGKAALLQAGIGESALDARLLLECVCGTRPNDLLAHGERPVAEDAVARYCELVSRRCERIPLQYLTGEQDFMGLTFLVNESVLIPRQDTEILAEEVLKELHDGMRILDMGTGSGCILISLLRYSNRCKGVGVDISAEALLVAQENGRRILGELSAEAASGEARAEDAFGGGSGSVEDASDGGSDGICPEHGFEKGLSWVQSDLFAHIAGKFDFIVSNPPYIRSCEIPLLMPEVREHEPLEALDGGGDGLRFYRKIIEEGRDYLVSGGMLYFETGCRQAQDVKGLMERAGFREVTVVRDYAGLERVVYGTWLV